MPSAITERGLTSATKRVACGVSSRNRLSRRFGGLEIDDELKFGWLHDRQVGRLFALEDMAGIDTSLTMGAVRFIP
jgi:hypothetical protein